MFDGFSGIHKAGVHKMLFKAPMLLVEKIQQVLQVRGKPYHVSESLSEPKIIAAAPDSVDQSRDGWLTGYRARF